MNLIRKNSDTNSWSKNSWKNFKISQQPTYNDTELLESIKNKLSSLPPIVNHKEIVTLKSKLELCHDDQCFVIQVGDCAERFTDATEEMIQSKIIFFNMLSHVLAYHLKKEILILGRIAGQYAKPRSNNFEILENGEKIEVFRGDIINDITADPQKRKADPERMCTAYYNSISTINQIKNWNFYGDKSIENFKKIHFENKSEIKSEKFTKKLLEYYNNFPSDSHDVDKSNIYASHEALLLDYEECFLREKDENYYDLSGHFLWIGERTGNINEAHVEFFRGISNPIGIKVSSRTNLDELMDTIKIINPNNEKGRVTLITRFGLEITENCLGILCRKIKENNHNVIFICDPNHGNTKTHEESKKKVRYFDELVSEVIITYKVLLKNGQHLSGIHLEASSCHVTECLGGFDNQVTEIIEDAYTTYCDPRLNILQALELSDYVGKFINTRGNVDDFTNEN